MKKIFHDYSIKTYISQQTWLNLLLIITLIVFSFCTPKDNSMVVADKSVEVIDIGSRRELFVDNYLIDHLDGARLYLHHPQPREVVLTCDQPWEKTGPGYTTVFKDGGIYRMYS